jgi:hypothetical protein
MAKTRGVMPISHNSTPCWLCLLARCVNIFIAVLDCDNLRLCLPDQRLNLVCDLRCICKENWTFRPEQQEAGKTLVVGMF